MKDRLAQMVMRWRIMAGAAPSAEEAAVLRHCSEQVEAILHSSASATGSKV